METLKVPFTYLLSKLQICIIRIKKVIKMGYRYPNRSNVFMHARLVFLAIFYKY